MIKLAIIDDEAYMLSEIKKCIISNMELKKSTDIYLFDNTERFIQEQENGLDVQILISDIEMPGMDGIEFGKMLRKDYQNIYLIFLTSHPEYALKSYEIDAYQYVLKETMEDRLSEILQKLVLKIEKESRSYRLVGTENNTKKIYLNNIIQIKKLKGGKYVEYITVEGNYKERISITQLMQELKAPELIMIGRSNVVNIRHIDSVRGNIICLSDKEKIPVSKARSAAVKREIHERWRNFE